MIPLLQGWIEINEDYLIWVAGVLEGCLNLKKLIVYGVVSEAETHEKC